VSLNGTLLEEDSFVGVKPEMFDRGDGRIIIRYKVYRAFKELNIGISLDGQHLVVALKEKYFFLSP